MNPAQYDGMNPAQYKFLIYEGGEFHEPIAEYPKGTLHEIVDNDPNPRVVDQTLRVQPAEGDVVEYHLNNHTMMLVPE